MKNSNENINKDNKESKELSTLKAIALGAGLGALNIACTAGGLLTGATTAACVLMPNIATDMAELVFDPLVESVEDIIGVQLDDFTPWEEQVYCAYGPAPGPEYTGPVTGFN